MSKPDVRAIVDLHIDFIVQNASADTMQCHFTDGWGPSSSDPKGQEGLQDCLLNRYSLCAASFYNLPGQPWFDFTACLFRNQKATDTIDDNMQKFNATVRYCSSVAGLDHKKLQCCAESVSGAALLQQSHRVEKSFNPLVDETGHHHPDWIQINGHDYGSNSSADWLALVCEAYPGSPKPNSCANALLV